MITILTDSRESRPLDFSKYDVKVVRQKLDVGDYGCMVGKEVVPVVFERKTVTDAYGSLSKGYKRFRRELIRANDSDIKLILIVEGTLSKVLKGTRYSKIKGISMLRKICTLWQKYGLTPVFVKDRAEMTLFIVEYFQSWLKFSNRH